MLINKFAPKKCKLWDEAELLTFHDFDDLNQLLPHYHDSG